MKRLEPSRFHRWFRFEQRLCSDVEEALPGRANHMRTTLRWTAIFILAVLLVLFCTQQGRAEVKGTPVPLLNIVFSLIGAAIAAACVKHGFKTTAAIIVVPFIGGITGAIVGMASFGQTLHSPYFAVAGLLAGTIVALIPSLRLRRASNDAP